MVAIATIASADISYVAKAIVMSSTQPSTDLQLLERAALQLSKMENFSEVRKIRDRAEAARKYAQTAAFSLKIQNRAAELKLRAERRAGQILNEILPHGGNRRSSYHDGNLKLTDLGINSNQSSRWRREAAIPEAVFERYVSASNRLCQDITAQGLLRLGKLMSARQKRPRASQSHTAHSIKRRARCVVQPGIDPRRETDSAKQIHSEILNHRHLLEEILRPICNGEESDFALAEKRLVLRLLSDMKDLLQSLEMHLHE